MKPVNKLLQKDIIFMELFLAQFLRGVGRRKKLLMMLYKIKNGKVKTKPIANQSNL